MHQTELFRVGNQVVTIGSYVPQDHSQMEERPVNPPRRPQQENSEEQDVEALRRERDNLMQEFQRLTEERMRLQVEREAQRTLALQALARNIPRESALFEVLLRTGALGNTHNPLPVVEVAPPPKHITENCSVCLQDFDKRSSEAAFIECTHWYHFNCIKEWTDKGHKNCPECRKETECIYRMKLADELDSLPSHK